MNILVLNYEFPPIGGGASPVSYDISRKYAEHGHSVHVVTMKYGALPADETIDGMSIHRVKCIRREKFVCHPWEQLSYIISAVFYLNKYIRSNQTDVVHVHFVIPTGVVAWYLSKRFGIPYIITAHGSDVPGHNNKRFCILYKLLINPWRRIVKEADYVVAPSEHLADLITDNMNKPGQGFDVAKVRLITNGIDTSVFRNEDKEKRILLMGRVQETKGMQDILECLTKETLKDWTIDIVGDGPYISTLKRIVQERELDKNVIFHGWIKSKSNEQLSLLAKAYIFISASHVENCPLTPAEAYCSGCRVVLSDIPGHKAVMEDAAEYFAIGDKARIVKIIDRLISEFDIRETKGNSEINKERFDWDYRVLLYEELLKN